VFLRARNNETRIVAVRQSEFEFPSVDGFFGFSVLRDFVAEFARDADVIARVRSLCFRENQDDPGSVLDPEPRVGGLERGQAHHCTPREGTMSARTSLLKLARRAAKAPVRVSRRNMSGGGSVEEEIGASPAPRVPASSGDIDILGQIAASNAWGDGHRRTGRDRTHHRGRVPRCCGSTLQTSRSATRPSPERAGKRRRPFDRNELALREHGLTLFLRERTKNPKPQPR